MTEFKVYLRGKHIDSVFYSSNKVTASDVKRSLIDHDNYDPSINVRKVGKK
jgi:hypothetical protein